MTIEIGTTVLHPDQWTRKNFPTGTVVEIGTQWRKDRVRVKWHAAPDRPRNLRTWVAVNRLTIVR
jgi:hypothetical protein